MSTVIGKQVKAFGDSVLAAHHEAMAYWAVQDVALAGPAVVSLVVDLVERRRAQAALEETERTALIQASREMLTALTDGRGMIAQMIKCGFDVEGEALYADATLQMRELLASLDEAVPSATTSSAGPTYDQLAAAAKSHPPSQSWFEEEVKGLPGPGR